MNLKETCPLVRWREGCKCGWVCLALELWQGHVSHPSLTRALLVSLQDPDLVPFPRWILQVPGVVGRCCAPGHGLCCLLHCPSLAVLWGLHLSLPWHGPL